MGWMINGVPHTGQILTVGPSGRDFSHPQDAYAAAEDGALLLVDPGTYALKVMSSNYWIFNTSSKRIYIRGLGSDASKTVFASDVGKSYGGYYLTAYVFRHGGIENIKIVQYVAVSWASTIGYASTDPQFFISKCHIQAISGYSRPCVNKMSSGVDTGFIKCRYTYLQRGAYQFAGTWGALDLSLIHIDRSELWGEFYNYNTKNSFAYADYVIAPTEGYGYNYGDFLITEGGKTIAAKEQHYRRLRNG